MKKAELTTQQIVLLIILITSFVIILLLLFRLNLKEQTQDQICHNSVILKGKSTFGSGNLDCKTSYVCVSGGENCNDITPTKTIEVNSQEVNEIYKAIADEMANCWWMFGEGKVDYTTGFADTDRVCAVCSSIKFSNINIEDFSYSSLTNFLKGNKIRNTQQNYFDYLFGSGAPEFISDSTKLSLSDGYVLITGRDDRQINLPLGYSILGTRTRALFGYL